MSSAVATTIVADIMASTNKWTSQIRENLEQSRANNGGRKESLTYNSIDSLKVIRRLVPLAPDINCDCHFIFNAGSSETQTLTKS